MKRAVVVAEDAKFSDHEGFDWEAIEKAREKNRKKGRVVAGGSTISQQLAKNLFLSGERSALRKGQEALITVMIEHVMDKRRILEIYLNVIEWGEGVFGAEAAARHYYGISAASLGARVRSACQAASVPGVRSASAPPATMASARPAWMVRIASPSAIAEDEQAVEKFANGPRRPWRTATFEPAALFIAITTVSGRRRHSFLP